MTSYSNGKLWVGRALLVATATYGAYRIYNSKEVQQAFQAVKSLLVAGWNVKEVLAASAELSSKVVSDLKDFIDSEDDDIPRSFIQFSKLLASKEMCQATRAITSAIVEGAGNAGLDEGESLNGVGVVDRMLERIIDGMLSEKGRSLVSLAISVAARNTVRSICDNLVHNGMGGRVEGLSCRGAVAQGRQGMIQSLTAGFLGAVATQNGERLVELGISTFARSFVGACRESLEGSNLAEGVLSAMARPGNMEALREIAGASSREAVTSFVTEASRSLTASSVALPPPSVSVNNFQEVGCSSPAPESPTDVLYVTTHSPPQNRNNIIHSDQVTGEDLLPSSSKFPHLLDQVTNTLARFCRVPEARDMVVSMAGSMAKEGARGFMLSIPDLTQSYWRLLTRGDLSGCQDVSSTVYVSTWLTVLLTAILYTTTQYMVS